MGRSRWRETFIGFAIGFGVGAALGVLFAPQSGEEMRDYLAEGAKDAVDGAMATGRKFTRRAKRAVDDVAEHVKDAAEVVEQAYTQAKGA
jgi:gas vesicle protein